MLEVPHSQVQVQVQCSAGQGRADATQSGEESQANQGRAEAKLGFVGGQRSPRLAQVAG